MGTTSPSLCRLLSRRPAHKPVASSDETLKGLLNANIFGREDAQSGSSASQIVPNSGGGFLLKEVQSGSLTGQLGLRPGDIARSANGQVLNYADDIQRVYRQFADARHLKLELYRDGKREELNYQIR